ncbi:glycosyltransferase [Dichotomopilus funicola]|uniref:Sterol 3-beta-glucosyltransferase n=1 Tax=Dichotomopilus funicola TaxID=1934379 RepID=A0AAN6V888_9PEZI|nr:glycosyltransferase [Dichotomopilus funicola]
MEPDRSAPPPTAARSPPLTQEPTNTTITQHSLPPSSPPTATSPTSQDDRAVRRVSRKLLKKRRAGEFVPPMELPDRLKDQAGGEEELLRPQGYGGGMFMNMNQSIFGLIAAAGSQADFAERFEGGPSSDEEDERENPMAKTVAGPKELRAAGSSSSSSSSQALAQTTILPKHGSSRHKSDHSSHRRKLSESRLLKSVPGFARLGDKIKSSKSASGSSSGKNKNDAQPPLREDTTTSMESDSSPAELAPGAELARAESRTAPVMSRMLEARAQMAARQSFDLDGGAEAEKESPRIGDDAAAETGPTDLALQLADIFQFERPEEVIQEYPCWLLQHVLLTGYLYITTRHIAFYAYLPRKSQEVAKSGYLSKCGKRNPKYNRYWFRLKGDVFSYYRDPQDLYFPQGQIDLRYGISATITDKDKEGINFTVTTDNRTYYFKADSPQSAKEWVKSLQRVIFRSHNDGDSVKISLPIQNVIDIEEAQMLDFADTCKIRVIDNDETYAIDEYFFSFFGFGKEPMNVLKILIEDATPQAKGGTDRAEPSGESSKRTSGSGSRDQPPSSQTQRRGKVSEGVKATLSPLSPLSPLRNSPSQSPRASADRPRTSFDGLQHFIRRSTDGQHHHSPLHSESRHARASSSTSRRSGSRQRASGHERQESMDSYVQSMDDPSQASLSGMIASASSEDPSASQILQGSDVFHSPTLQRAGRAQDAQRALSSTPTSMVPRQQPHHVSTKSHSGDGFAADGTVTTPTLQSIATVGVYPFRKANALIGYLDKHSRRMSTLLATESMGYVEKVSGMWKGGGKHYDDPAELRTDDEEGHGVGGEYDPEDRAISEARFQAHFALPETEKLRAAYFGHMMRVLPLYGKIYISDRHFCFRSLLPGTRTKLVLPLRDIETVDKEKGFRFGYAGLVVVIARHEELFFEFHKADVRDDCAITILQSLEEARYLEDHGAPDDVESEDAQAAVAEHNALQKARTEEFADHEVELPREPSSNSEAPTILFDDPKASFLNFKPAHSMRITCLTIGSRGDVQPYIALCKRLLEEGHRPRIATHGEFQPWIESHGIEFAYVGGDPAELMQLCIQNGTFTLNFFREANAKMRDWLDELLVTAWNACQGSDLVIESPSAMAGIHIAEALGVPYFRAFTMPWTRTRAYPHAFIMPGQKMGGAYNYVTYVMFETVFWKTTAHQINRWRRRHLGLPNTSLEKLQMNKVPFLYNFSPYVVPPPLDYSDWIRVTGYWFLDEGNAEKYQPAPELAAFIARARRDGKKLVYVGFGSILVPDPAKMTQEVIDAVLKADVRCILSKGWSDRLPTKKDRDAAAAAGEPASAQQEKPKTPEPELPPEIFQIQSAPHDWLFKQIDAAAHHGGSGTTGSSLRAGIPTVIRPFFGDQYFFGTRVEDLGVGICLKKWGATSFARALWEATHSERMIVKARALGEQIRKENGVDHAIKCIYRDLEYATELIRAKRGKSKTRTTTATGTGTDGPSPDSPLSPRRPGQPGQDDEGGIVYDPDDDDLEEESWTFVGGDAETIDDLSVEGTVKRAVGMSVGGVGAKRGPVAVLGGAPGAGATTGLGVKGV